MNDNDIDIEVGSRVRLAREAARMTQAQLATALGVVQGRMSDLEAGRIRWSVQHLQRAASALGVRPERLMPPGVHGSLSEAG